MQDIRGHVTELVESWKNTYDTASGAPSSWRPYLPISSLVLVDEVVQTISYWLSRVRAPSGFSPGFHLAKALAAASLPPLIGSSKQLEAGQYNHFPTFVSGLLNLLSSLHTMVVFSQKGAADSIAADLSAQLSQGLSLLGTAQKELAEKSTQLGEAGNLAEMITEKHDEILTLTETARGLAAEMAQRSDEAQSSLEAIKVDLERTDQHKAEFQALLSENSRLQSSLTVMERKLGELQKQSANQLETIDSILPKGASAGLASAFAQRGAQLNLAKWIWMGLFVATIGGLSYFAYDLIHANVPQPEDFWRYVLYRLPLAAPLIWLGWFSAIQYGNIVRVQEDYAFKEATSKAFQGYRDHLEHLASVNVPEASTAMNLMAAKTIEILAHEPLRIYGKTAKDASPAHGLADLLTSLKSRSQSE